MFIFTPTFLGELRERSYGISPISIDIFGIWLRTLGLAILSRGEATGEVTYDL